MASMFKHWRTTYERIEKYLSDKYFTDVNLYGKIISETEVLSSLSHYNDVSKPELTSQDHIQLKDNSAFFSEKVINAPHEKWTVININNFSFGPTWSIHWFKVCFVVPSHWLGRNGTSIELQWKSGCEVLVYSSSGEVVTGLNATYSRISIPLHELAALSTNNQIYTVYLQASCSGLFGAGNGGMIKPPDNEKSFTIETAQIALISTGAMNLARDLKILLEIADALKDSDRGFRALFVANEAINALVDLKEGDMGKKYASAQIIVDQFFDKKNGESQVTLHVMGHCHIDTAWMWRYVETRRKLARSWSTTLRLLESNPSMTFVCSQAQQLSWLKEDYPDLFLQLQTMASKKQFLPSGGTWVEMDVNMPCCESLCRQFLYGQRFFKENFGSYCKEFWLPDTFGYSPQLPQIMVDANISRFMTQKLSWSLVNKFPNHSFWWSGIDGSRVLTHFPPGNSYSMSGKISEILLSASNFSDKGRSSSVMYLYGHGDGGQGPTEEMVHVMDRLRDCDGIPKLVHSSPDKFFQELEDRDANNLCVWTGELFLELHNGTYTSQRQIKKGNSHCEQLLRAVEFMTSLALCRSSGNASAGCGDDWAQSLGEALESHWKMLLLNQFHDVLPGSSIEQVCDDAYWCYDTIRRWCCGTINELSTLLTKSTQCFINPTCWPLLMPVSNTDNKITSGFALVPPYTVCSAGISEVTFPVVGYTHHAVSGIHTVTNQYFEVTIDEQCRIMSLLLTASPHLGNLFKNPANELFLYDDVPLYWDAWDVMDYHLETGTALCLVDSFRLKKGCTVTRDDVHVTLHCTIVLESTGTMITKSVSIYSHLDYIQLNTQVISWKEEHKFLKVRVPTFSNAMEVHYRTQAGIISRPSHRNTSWDAAKYEVCSHDWLHIGETNWGVALFKDSIFGSSVIDGSLYLSLLRSPTSPDNTADRKYLPHSFSYAIYPYSDAACNSGHKFATISRKAAQFCWLSTFQETVLNCEDAPSLQHRVPMLSHSFPIRLISPNSGEVSLDWIKPSCDNRHIFIVRLHEQVGGRFLVKLQSDLALEAVHVTNILEEVNDQAGNGCPFHYGDRIEITILPFKIVSLAIKFGL